MVSDYQLYKTIQAVCQYRTYEYSILIRSYSTMKTTLPCKLHTKKNQPITRPAIGHERTDARRVDRLFRDIPGGYPRHNESSCRLFRIRYDGHFLSTNIGSCFLENAFPHILGHLRRVLTDESLYFRHENRKFLLRCRCSIRSGHLFKHMFSIRIIPRSY